MIKKKAMNKKKAHLALALIAVFVAGAIAGYVWHSLTIPFKVKEPLEVIEYPTLLELYAGENKTFTINITNHASDVNYLVTLAFSLNDTEYQTSYVTFSDTSYTAVPGLNTLEAWVKVAHDAPTAELELRVDFSRAAPP